MRKRSGKLKKDRVRRIRNDKGEIRIKGESGRRNKEEREQSLQFIKVLWRISLCVLVVHKYIYRNTHFTITAPAEYKIC